MLHRYFDKIYFINLDRDYTRRERCEKLFRDLDIQVERFAGIDVQKEKEKCNYYNNIIFSDTLKESELGCLLSHISIIKNAINKGYKSIIIFEDDIEFCQNFIEQFENYYRQLPDDWCLLYFSGNHLETPHLLSNNIMRVKKTLTTHSYAIKKDLFKTILEHPMLFHQPIDIFYAKYIQPYYPSYCFYPHLTYQRNTYSNIQNKPVNYAFIQNYQLPITVNYIFKRPSDAIRRIIKKFISKFNKIF